jgi:hypothetical protein
MANINRYDAFPDVFDDFQGLPGTARSSTNQGDLVMWRGAHASM